MYITCFRKILDTLCPHDAIVLCVCVYILTFDHLLIKATMKLFIIIPLGFVDFDRLRASMWLVRYSYKGTKTTWLISFLEMSPLPDIAN